MIGSGLELGPDRRRVRRNVLIVGSDSIAGRLSPKLEDTGEVQVVGYLDDDDGGGNGGNGGNGGHGGSGGNGDGDGNGGPGSDHRCLGSVRELREVCRREKVDHVVFAMSRCEAEGVETVVPFSTGGRRFVGGGWRSLAIVPNRYVVLPQRGAVSPPAASLGRELAVAGRAGAGAAERAGIEAPLSPQLLSKTKRALDIAGAALALAVFLPLLVVAALAIRLTSRGPVIFRQERVGLDGNRFSMLKLRSMRIDTDPANLSALAEGSSQPAGEHLGDGCVGPFPKLKRDPRVTRVGCVIRRLSIDEIPQLWNVLRGDMSLVGPRPFVPKDAELIEGWAQDRNAVRPGVTGLWQVAGRNDVTFEDMCRLDHLYVHCWSLRLDLRLLLRTVPAVLRRSGAY